VLLKSSGWAMHQLYWWGWQAAVVQYHDALKRSMEAWALVTVFAYVLVYIGNGLVVSPYATKVWKGSGWYLPIAASGGLLFAIGGALAVL